MATNDQGNNQGSKQGGKSGNQQSAGKRGFASMDPELQRRIAAEGGRAAHEKGTAHEFTSEEARRAGSMSHKNDSRSKQSADGGSRSGAAANNAAASDGADQGGGRKAGAGAGGRAG